VLRKEAPHFKIKVSDYLAVSDEEIPAVGVSVGEADLVGFLVLNGD